jgi:sulfur relay (sulfurtransferase) DsrC/TusE family protein
MLGGLGKLGGLFSSSVKGQAQINPSNATAHAKEKVHGPFPLQVQLTETVGNDGKRAVEASFMVATTKGVVVEKDAPSLLESIKEVYKKRLEEKTAENAAAKEKAAANKVAQNKKIAETLAAGIEEGKQKVKKEADKKHMYEVIQYLREIGFKYKTNPLLASVIDPSDQAKYNSEKFAEKLKQTYGKNMLEKEKAEAAAKAAAKVENTRFSSLGSNTPSAAAAVSNTPVAEAEITAAAGGKRRTRHRRNKRRNRTNRR